MHVLARSDSQAVRHVGQKLNAIRQLYASLFSITDAVRRNYEHIRIYLHVLQRDRVLVVRSTR